MIAAGMELDTRKGNEVGSRRRRLPYPVRLAGRVFLLMSGVFLFVLALRGLIQPNHLLSGGVTGTALLLANLTHVPVGLGIALLNVPVFLLGIRYIGREFAVYSAVAVATSWLAADYVPFTPLTKDPLLAGVFGGLLFGVGTALAMRAGGSLGGFDILGVVINRRFGLGVGEVLLTLNAILIIASGIIKGPELAMYTLVSIFTCGKTIDALQAPRSRKAFLIMTRRPDPIRQRVVEKMGRGLTVFKAEGAYTHADITALLCVITRPEVKELSDLIEGEDPEAFVVVLEAGNVLGSFRTPSAAAYWKRLQEPLPPSGSSVRPS
jgi:uncharacterized membrane-anchored protein YitT (DUF2179 family)